MADLVCADDITGGSKSMFNYNTLESMEKFLDYMKDRREFKSVKDEPPIGIIHFPSLMNKAWTWKRIVPWRGGYVFFKDYMDYLKKYFAENATVLSNLRDAADRCLKMEKKYVDSRGGPLSEEDARLSGKIMQLANGMRNSEGASVVAAAGLMCIAEEARLLSKLSASDTEMFILSNKVRWYASEIMIYEGPESESVAAGLMGMAKEASIARKLLNAEDGKSSDRNEVCQIVRANSLNLLILFRNFFVLGAPATSTTDKTKGKSADDNFAGNTNSMDIDQHKKKKRKRMRKIQDSEGMAVSRKQRS